MACALPAVLTSFVVVIVKCENNSGSREDHRAAALVARQTWFTESRLRLRVRMVAVGAGRTGAHTLEDLAVLVVVVVSGASSALGVAVVQNTRSAVVARGTLGAGRLSDVEVVASGRTGSLSAGSCFCLLPHFSYVLERSGAAACAVVASRTILRISEAGAVAPCWT